MKNLKKITIETEDSRVIAEYSLPSEKVEKLIKKLKNNPDTMGSFDDGYPKNIVFIR